MRYRVGCAYCRWQGCTDFESLEEVNRYLDELTATRAAPLRGWRIAHRAANERIRRAYGRSTLFPPKTTSLEGLTSVSFSTIAWDRYVELRRPPRQQPPPSRVREAAPSPHHGLTETEVEEETRVFDEIARMNEAYMSNPEALNPTISSSSARLHPAVALEKLRALYTNRAIRRVADDGALEKQPRNFPNYVVEMKCRDVYPSENREKKELESIYNQRPAFSDEACWIAAAQQAQWGLHPSFIATAPDAEALRRIFSSYSNSLMSGGNDEGGMSGIAPLRGLRNPFAASLLPAHPPTIAELPTTQAGREPALQDHSRLDRLLRDIENRKFCEGLTNYFPARLLKEGIAGTVLYSEQDGVGEGLKVDEFANTSIQTEESGAEKNSTSDVVVKVQDGESSYTTVKKNRPTRTLIILDRSSQEEDVKQSLEYWQSHLDHPESDLASLRSNPRCNIVFANHFNAVRVLPYLQYVISSRLAKAHGEDDESSDVENPSKSLVVLSFRFINLGVQEMVIRRVRVARRHLGGGKHSCIELSSRYTQIFHPTITPPPTLEKKSAVERNTSSTGEQNGWVRLLPRCSRDEAAVANFTDYAAVELPSDLAANCIDATTELRFDITLNGVDVDPAEPDGVDSGFKAPHIGRIYVGLAIDAFTFLDTSPFSCDEEVFPSSAANGYHAISFGNTIVW
ncbi:unnamed protein product [Phytomonas sp. EM1]|nr:unnamed protein product [Phytomonas sp. EM1]|eukprot:CCW62540.1 unnamed protein product [Phytomonas sp. isolate EM1]